MAARTAELAIEAVGVARPAGSARLVAEVEPERMAEFARFAGADNLEFRMSAVGPVSFGSSFSSTIRLISTERLAITYINITFFLGYYV